ncbi:hypothetical protein [Oscillatoria acuminata]|uniref:hypothetical protein n=1 Tax=Oscillatoria acuminata TaxID=118323 RepID=UPI0002E0C09C|nr:hypothetical protein [Oscillatoria acuminata]
MSLIRNNTPIAAFFSQSGIYTKKDREGLSTEWVLDLILAGLFVNPQKQDNVHCSCMD